MKLYVWEEVLCDYTCGVIFAMAHNIEEAKLVVLDSTDRDWRKAELECIMKDSPCIYDTPHGGFICGGG